MGTQVEASCQQASPVLPLVMETLPKLRVGTPPHTLLPSITASSPPCHPIQSLMSWLPCPSQVPPPLFLGLWCGGPWAGQGSHQSSLHPIPTTPWPPGWGLRHIPGAYVPPTDLSLAYSVLVGCGFPGSHGGVGHIRPQLSPPHGSGRLHTCLPHFFCGSGSIFRVLS